MTLAVRDWLADFCQEADVDVAPHGATPAQLDHLEQELGIPLPASYRDCLQLWNGAADFGSWQIYAIAEIRDAVQYYGFRAGVSDPGGGDYSFIYQAKPLALLPFAQRTFSADLFCFDTRQYQVSAGEYTIVEYDHEVWEITTCYSSFAAFLQQQAQEMTEDLEYFLGQPENAEAAEKRCDYWAERLS